MEEFAMHWIRFSKVRKSSTTQIEMKPPTSYSNNHKKLRIHPNYEYVKRQNQIQNNSLGKHAKKAYKNIINVN